MPQSVCSDSARTLVSGRTRAVEVVGRAHARGAVEAHARLARRVQRAAVGGRARRACAHTPTVSSLTHATLTADHQT